MGTTACCHQESSPEPPHTRTSSSSSSPSNAAQDEAIATDLASIGARTKPLEPPEVLSPRARSGHAPLRRVVAVAAGESPGKPLPPSVVAVGDRRRAISGSMDYGVTSHTSLSDSPVAHPSLFPFSGYCWWSVVLSVRETGVTLLYDDASGVTRCPPDRR
uniref:Uncharacterized protein n=1 Tax=Brassica oleracea var. oleracea TaxID=109376 RepID=A0A0D3DAM3_BRAOL